jgi:hypothetical protein
MEWISVFRQVLFYPIQPCFILGTAMKTTKFIILFLSMVSISCTHHKHVQNSDIFEANLFRNFILSQCIARAYPNSEVACEARSASAGYLEFGSLPIEAYEEAILLVEKTLSVPYLSKNGRPLHIMKCLDLSTAQSMNDLIRKYAPESR